MKSFPPNKTFFTSDPHFFHKNIKRYCPTRPGDSVAEMNQILIDNINEKIPEDGHLFLLGDILFCKKRDVEAFADQIFGQIKCKNLYLIRGNHDYFYKAPGFAKYFQSIEYGMEIKIQDSDARNGKSQRIVMCHFPMMTWNQAAYGSFMLHGHCHNSLSEENKKTTRLDVGVDNPLCDYFPVSYKEVKEELKNRNYTPVDCHE